MLHIVCFASHIMIVGMICFHCVIFFALYLLINSNLIWLLL
uniref:Uncharacterized protein n=1 Tax=Rhizophora mucronata TaxID=61149 RepID=A0A2P2QN25_RHIMU